MTAHHYAIELFDNMLLNEHITIPQWRAARLFGETLATRRADKSSLYSESTMETTVLHTDWRVFIGLFSDESDALPPEVCVESLAKIIGQNLDFLTELYGTEDTPDPRAILRRQVKIGR
jgi:hypothetical protein